MIEVLQKLKRSFDMMLITFFSLLLLNTRVYFVFNVKYFNQIHQKISLKW